MRGPYDVAYWWDENRQEWDAIDFSYYDEYYEKGFTVVPGNTAIGPPEGPPGMYEKRRAVIDRMINGEI